MTNAARAGVVRPPRTNPAAHASSGAALRFPSTRYEAAAAHRGAAPRVAAHGAAARARLK
ncbi:hypothetical protein C7405_106222 [Paraburkholderia caballeronis]|uniref:hypothetical protein n=1 Tax=Paraburkholderia caballeronis TaxID=416943 RepID=UPI001065ACF0|nr:hypothetical protein [Paraburkholderia caballeronis]TDV35190.1 hypothetical protein C7405_106222 [Paraburkholderia caballeronis]